MLNVSEAFKRKIKDGEPVYQALEITFPDGTVKTVEEGIMDGGSVISDCAESSSFPIGSVICKSLTVELDNTEEQWKNFSFFGARINLRLKMTILEEEEQLFDTIKTAILDSNIESIFTPHSDSQMYVESIDYGTFTITTPEQYGEIITITALDDAYKLNSLYYSSLKLPQTVSNLVRDACETLDIPMGFSSLTHGDIIVSEIPDSMTFRQLLGWAAMLECANARIDNKGYLQFVKWDFSTDPIDVKDYLDIPVVSSDDIVITGIKVKSGDNSEFYGETGYVLDLENNIIEQSDLATVAALIGDAIIGSKFRNLQGDLAYNPLLEFGDMVGTYDHNMNRYLTPITDISSEINGITTIKTQADDPIRGSSQFVSQGVKAIAEARRLVKIEKTEREKAVERLAGMLASSGGLYMTEEPQEDGSTIYYMHNKHTLKESDIVWKLTAEAFAISTDGGKTYPYGFAVTGELITRLLYAEGINATYINAGALIVKDKNGKVIFVADMESGSVRIDASYVQIGESSLDKTLDNMQGQIDGNIETWTGNDVPTLDNYPAKNWLTDEERNKHVGDVYYDKHSHSYRYRNVGQGYEWQLLKDTDITKALRDAAEAKEQAANAENLATLAKNLTMQLSNDYQGIPVDSDGNYTVFPDCQTSAVVMYGTQDITNSCSFRITTSENVTGSWNEGTATYLVSGLTSDSAWVDIKATYLNTLSVTKRFTVAKQYAGVQGTPGKDGTDGKTQYTHLAYANSEDGQTDFSVGDSDRSYIGMYVDFNSESSMDPSDYSWTLVKGRDGEQGIPGKQGENGLTPYVHIAYANSADGQTDFSLDNSTDKKYFGQYTDYHEDSSQDPEQYKWALIKGNDGLDGRVYHLRANTTILLMGKDDKVTPEKLVVNAYYRDGQEDEKPYNGWWKAERSTDSGTTWTTIGLSQSTATNSCAITSSLQIIGTHGMIRVTCYSDQAKTKIVDSQTYSVAVDAENLKQNDIVDILSNSGKWKGLYYLNGNLYISFNAARGGTLTLGGENDGDGLLEIYNENSEKIGYIDRTGVHFNEGTFSGRVEAAKVIGSTVISDNKSTATKIDGGAIQLRNTALAGSNYGSVETADWSSESEPPNAGFIQTSSRFYPDIANSDVQIEENVAVIDIDAFWGLFVRAEKEDVASFGKKSVQLYGETGIHGDTYMDGDLNVYGGNGQIECTTLLTKYLHVEGAKNRVTNTENYGKQYLHSFETPTPMFCDVGTSRLNESGKDIIPISDIFLETVNTSIEYQVFLQKEGRGDIWVEEKEPLYFRVCGTPNLKYSWEIKAVQRDYEHIRFDDVSVLSDQDSELENLDRQADKLQDQELKELEEADQQMLAEMERRIKNENSVNDINN